MSKFFNRKMIAVACGLFAIVWFLGMLVQRQKAERAKQGTSAAQATPTPTDRGHAHAADVVRMGAPPAIYTSLEAPRPSPTVVPIEKRKMPVMVTCDLQVQATPTPTPAPEPEEDDFWLARGTLISCVTMGEIDSGHITTPVLLWVTENVYQQINGKAYLILPVGTKLLAFATANYDRDRIQVKGTFDAILPHSGLEVTFDGVVLTKEYDQHHNEYGPYEASAGLRGTFFQSDNIALLRNLAGYLLTTLANTATNSGGQLLEGALSGGGNSALSLSVPSAAPYISPFVNGLVNPNQISDSLMVRVSRNRECYVCNTSIVDIRMASKGASLQKKIIKAQQPVEEDNALSNATKILNTAYKQVEKTSKQNDNQEATDPDAAIK